MPKLLGVALGFLRVVVLIFVLVIGLLVTLLAGLLPGRMGGARPAGWVATGLARCFCTILNVRVRCSAPQSFRQHRGLIFPNHLTYLDIIALLSQHPVRFLSAAEVKNYPIIGWIAAAIGCLFVARDNQASREQARVEIAAQLRRNPEPPLILFPEGRVGPGNALLPFRHGAFELASENRIAYLPCALRYTPQAVARWHADESLVAAIWRLASFPGPLRVDVILLPVVQPQPADAAEQLAAATQAHIANALGLDLK